MRIVTTSNIVHREGQVLSKERGAVVKHRRVDYEHVREPVVVPRPQIEDFRSLVVVHDKVEYYS